VLALPLRVPKYTVTAMPRSRVASTVSTSPMRTLTASPLSSLQLTSAWLAPAARAAGQQLLGDTGQPLHALAAVVGDGGDFDGRAVQWTILCLMRGRDEETGEFLSPSRSQNRRDALDVLALGETLVAN
jgi:hypothetical protein